MPTSSGKSASPDPAVPRRRRGELQDRVAAQLRRGLMIGAFVPGQTITLRMLAKSLGTSLMPVREAINQLVAANALELLPNRSVAVRTMTRTRFAELTRARHALEGIAGELAAVNATPALVRRLGSINRELKEAISRRDIAGCLENNQAFHFALYEASRSEVLLPLIEALWLQAGPFMYCSLGVANMPWDASAHVDILAALRERDAAAVRRAIERDIAGTARCLQKYAPFVSANRPLDQLAAI